MLIGHWPLNGNIDDYSGFNRNGTIVGSLTSNNSGKIGKTYNFTNSNNGVAIQHNFAGLTEYTMAAWICPKGTHQNYNGTVFSSGNWNGTCWAFGVNQNNTAIDVAGRGYNKYINYTLTLNTWYHILSTVKNGVSKLYVNGVYIGETSVSALPLASDAADTCIGRETYADGHFSFNGLINDVRIYDNILSEYEIQELAKAKILHYTFDDPYEEPTTNLIPGGNGIDSYPNFGNGHGTFSVNQYNDNNYFSIGTISNISNNIVTLSSIGTPIYTYDVLNPQTTGGGVTAGTQYFIKKLSSTTFSLHAYNSSQDGSQGYINPSTGNYKVYDSIANDERVAISLSGFPTMWYGYAHQPNSSLVKEIIPNTIGTETETFHGHSFIRCHTGHKSNTVGDYMAYGVYPPVTAGVQYTFSFWYRASDVQSIGAQFHHTAHTNAGWPSSSGTLTATAAWKKASWTATAPGSGGTNMYWGGLANGNSIDISEIQVEQKTQATPFTLSTRPAGVIDISGYKNHGTVSAITESPTWVTDSKVGSGSIYFNGTNPHIISGLTNLGGLTTVTISFWRKNDTTITSWLPFVGQTTSHYIMATSSGTGGFYHVAIGSSWEIFKDGVAQGPLVAATPFTDQLWHHYVIRGVNLSAWTQFRINGYTGAWDNEGYFDDIRIYNTNLSNADIKSLYERKANLDNLGNVQVNQFYERENLLEIVNTQIQDQSFSNGLYSYTQSNCQVTLTAKGYRIYRPANLIYPAAGNTMWGGLRIAMDSIPNGKGILQKGRSYRLRFKLNGQSSNIFSSLGFTNNMGWGGGGLDPSPTVITSHTNIPSGFNGEAELIYEFTINDDVYKVCTASYSSFVAGNTYLSYRDLQLGFGYQSTGTLGTDIYITDIELFDITDYKGIAFAESGIGFFDNIDEVSGTKNSAAKHEITNTGTLIINGEFSEVD